MKEFRIKSSLSDVELRLFNIQGDYFTVEIVSGSMKAIREVWAYTDAYTFADLIEALASHDRPWEGSECWESLEGEFKFSATCTKLGQVMFEIELSQSGNAEFWLIKSQIRSDFGTLPILARSARVFFGNTPY
jgi:Family of unknown function (DUF6228)